MRATDHCVISHRVGIADMSDLKSLPGKPSEIVSK